MELAVSTKPVNVEDYRILAQRRLPKIIFDYRSRTSTRSACLGFHSKPREYLHEKLKPS
jgi:hypothetical protein